MLLEFLDRCGLFKFAKWVFRRNRNAEKKKITIEDVYRYDPIIRKLRHDYLGKVCTQETYEYLGMFDPLVDNNCVNMSTSCNLISFTGKSSKELENDFKHWWSNYNNRPKEESSEQDIYFEYAEHDSIMDLIR